MSLVEMQAALARLYVDDAFLQLFRAEPTRALDRYDLTPREATALAGIDRDALEKFASSLRSKTWKRFQFAYSLVHALGDEVVRRYFLRFYALRPIRPSEPFYRPTIELGEFFERSFAGNPEVPPWAAGLARYERLFYRARFDPRSPAAPASAELSGRLDGSALLRAAPQVRVERFGYDMGALEKALKERAVPREAPPADCHVVFQGLPELGRAKKFQVSELTAGLVSLCDGTRDVGAVADALDADPEAASTAAARLCELGLLQEVTLQ